MCNKIYYILLLIIFSPIFLMAAHHPPPPLPPFQMCLARCVAKCFEGAKSDQKSDQEVLAECQTKCRPYGQPTLCEKKDCWKRCKDLDPPSEHHKSSSEEQHRGVPPQSPLPPPKGLEAKYNPNMTIDVRWQPANNSAENAVKLYLLQLETEAPNHQTTQIFTARNAFSGPVPSSAESICGPIQIQVSQVGLDRGPGKWSKPVQIESNGPEVRPKMEVQSLKFNSTPFDSDEYTSNATINIELKFTMNGDWPLGTDDVEVAPVFHLVHCSLPDLSQAFPAPEFHHGTRPDTVQAFVGADLMYRRCRFMYGVDEVRSNHCGTTYHVTIGEKDLQWLDMNCHTVTGAKCPQVVGPSRAPMCGQFDNFDYTVLNTTNGTTSEEDDENIKIAVNVTFKINHRIKKLDPSYIVARFGNAQRQSREKELIRSVNMIDIIGEATNCMQFAEDRSCKQIGNEHSIVLDGLSRNTTYGVILCAIIDPNNLSYPDLNAPEKSLTTQAFEIFVPDTGESHEARQERRRREHKTKVLLRWVFGGAGALFGILLISCAAIYCIFRRQQDKLRKKRTNLEADMQRARGQRYTDFPARTRDDPWELERRNLIIYEDKRLGAGAFGSVYLGKLVGIQKNNGQLANSLSIGLMRAENPYLAVKMLPEYADELSKSDFLREIGLMKSLGYHERLVNMLACVTQSEPYCLVVEYCSDGDLLQFLRSRCKYMLELDEAGVRYAEPNCEQDFDRAMIMTLKQLLMFAVQISYGLEYLSQKGFVHRDVAARNILVQDKTHAKIGDFGLCRFIYADSANYKGRGGRLPIKWMSPEAIRHYEFTTSSDVWSFGVLMFEIITLGGTPYPGIQPDDMLIYLESGLRIPQPDNCPEEFYRVMCACWARDARMRPDFAHVRQQLAAQLECVSDEYAYLKLDANKDYYNVSYGELRDQRGCESSSASESQSQCELLLQSPGELAGGELSQSPDNLLDGEMTQSPNNLLGGELRQSQENFQRNDLTQSPNNLLGGELTQSPDNLLGGESMQSPSNLKEGEPTQLQENLLTQDELRLSQSQGNLSQNGINSQSESLSNFSQLDATANNDIKPEHLTKNNDANNVHEQRRQQEMLTVPI